MLSVISFENASQTLDGIGDLLSFQLASGKISGFISNVVPQIIPNAEGGFNVNITVYIQSQGPVLLSGRMTISFASKSAYTDFGSYGESGIVPVLMQFTVKKDELELWWPNGYGNRTVYKMHVSYRNTQGETHSVSKNIGFRKIELVQESLPDGEEGLSFYFKVNDVPVFVKGSNWIPADAFVGRITHDTIYKLLFSATLAHQNMIRICGVSFYESEDFFNVCDELGIMVWQEFMFSDALIPRDKMRPAWLLFCFTRFKLGFLEFGY
eukprot:m.96583 g.96583  ORF g.96583 m.96583 type:complete len:267 (+) comp36913_c0_seq6:607-1407(+)